MKVKREKTPSNLSQGNKLFRDNNFEEAVKKYFDSVSEKEHYFTYENIGHAFEKLNREDQAAVYYEKALNLSVNAVRAENFLRKSQSLGKVCLIRIIGNELPGLHSEDQNYINLKFILENEPSHPSVDKIFLINRVVSKIKSDKYKKLIKNKGFKYIEIPFESGEYEKISLYYDDLPGKLNNLDKWEQLLAEVSKRKLKNKYLMNNNGARNFALKYGVDNDYEWTLPLDGNCYFTKNQIDELLRGLIFNQKLEYVVIPMRRVNDNKEVNEIDLEMKATEEPQIGVKRTANTFFSEDRVYGNQPKVELLKVLGVPGKWDEWVYEYPWKKIQIREKKNEKRFFISSSIHRLSSGNNAATNSAQSRANIRANAIITHIDNVDEFLEKAKNNNSEIDFFYYEKTITESKKFNSKIKVNQYFDKIYVVNLKHQIEERLAAENHLKKHNIDFEVYTAVNGYQKKYVDWFNSYSKKPVGELSYFKKYEQIEKGRKTKLIESPGAVGYIQTYIKILKNARYNKHKRILILEDDVILCKDFDERFERFINSIKKDWKILLLGASQYGWKSVDKFYSLNNGFYYPRVNDTKGSFAIAFDESIYNDVINNQMHMDAPFDHIPLGDLYEKNLGKCFTAFPYLVMPDVTSSTIRGGRVQYEHSNRMKWWLGNFEFPRKKPNLGVVISDINNVNEIEDISNRNLPFTLNFLKLSNNGVVPIHDMEQVQNKSIFPVDNHQLVKLQNDYDQLLIAKDNMKVTKETLLEKLNNKSEQVLSLTVVEKNSEKSTSYVPGRVSVILPTYKRPENLKAASESVLKQSYEDVELVIVDDNGVDSEYCNETKHVVDLIKEEYSSSNIVYIKHKVNANGASARNTGIFACTGEYICFLDDDDIYLDGRIAKSVEKLKNTNNNVGAVYCGFLGWNSPKLDPERFAEGNLAKNLLTLDYKSHYLHTNTATYKRSAIIYINGFDPTFKRHQDLEFNLRFFEEYSIIAVKECLVRLAPTKSTVDNKLYGDKMFDLKIKFLRKFKAMIDSFDDSARESIYIKHWNEIINYAPDLKKDEKKAKEAYLENLGLLK